LDLALWVLAGVLAGALAFAVWKTRDRS